MILIALLSLAQVGAGGSIPLPGPHTVQEIRSLYGCQRATLIPAPLGDGAVPDRLPVPEPPCATVSTIDTLKPGGRSARTLSEALAGRIPGVSVLRSSGVLGTGSRVRMRGGSGFLIPREPLLVIDGMRVDGSQTSLGVGIGGQSPSRLDDIPLDDVERIETLRGPSASALYGADAAGGVILVTTKRGQDAPDGWSAYAESGVTTDAASYPSNSATGPPNFGSGTCTRAQAAVGECTPGPLSAWNPLERASPFRNGWRFAGGITTRGELPRTRYFAAASAARDQGPLAPNDGRKIAGRLNVDVRPWRSFRLGLLGSYSESRTTLPLGDNAPMSALMSGLSGNTADDPAKRGYLLNDPATLASIVTQQHIERSLGTIAPEWSPVRWLSVRGVVGREILRRNDSRTFPIAAAFADPTRAGPAEIAGNGGRDMRTTFGAAIATRYPLARTVFAATTFGAERLTQSFRLRDSVQRFFPDGTPAGSSSLWSHHETKLVGLYASQHLAWKGRELTLGIRRDEGDRRRLIEPATYGSAAIRWDVWREPFFKSSPLASTLVARAAYGEAGATRPAAAILQSPVFLPPQPGRQPTPLSLAPERVTEIEVGLEAYSLGGRLRADLAWFRQRSNHAYERGCCIGPFGYDDRGRWHTNGLEVALDADLFETLTSEGRVSLTFAHLSNTVDRSTGAQYGVFDRTPFVYGARALVPGYPIGGVWSRAVTGRDTNGDGIIDPSEISRAADTSYIGPSMPTREAALTAEFRVLRRVTLSTLLDYRGGFTVWNFAELFRCEVGTCAALYDPGASASDQTRAVTAHGGQGTPGFVEHGDFLRLREVALTWILVPGWALRNGFSEIMLTVAGRNLANLTGYSGRDPEVNGGGQSTFGTTESFTLPLPRTLLVRVSVQRCRQPYLLQCSGFR